MLGIKVHALRCGTVGTDETIPDRSLSKNHLAYTGMFRGEKHRVWLPVYCYLIEHPQGLVLVDAAWHTDVRGNQKEALSWELNIASKAELPAGEAVTEQLAALGITPSDLSMVFLTHLDVDHASGIKLIADAPRICASREELAAAARGEVRYNKHLWEGVDLEPIDLVEIGVGPRNRGFDVFGDGRIKLVDLAGHSAGMTGVLVGDIEHFIVITGDACYNRHNWEELKLPGITADADKALESVHWVRQMSHDVRCLEILPTHDPGVEPHVIEL